MYSQENIIVPSAEKNKVENIMGGSVRLASLDFYRGLVMVLLMFEASGLYEHAISMSEGSFGHLFAIQFTHAEWHGLHFWD